MGNIYQGTRCNILEDLTLQCALCLPVLQYEVNAVGSSSSEFPMTEMRLAIKTGKNVTNIPFGIIPHRKNSWQLIDPSKEGPY